MSTGHWVQEENEVGLCCRTALHVDANSQGDKPVGSMIVSAWLRGGRK